MTRPAPKPCCSRRAHICRAKPVPKPGSEFAWSIMSSAATRCSPRRRDMARWVRRRMGRASGVGSGLAAWRMGDCNASQAAFRDAMRLGRSANSSPPAYWGARARKPVAVRATSGTADGGIAVGREFLRIAGAGNAGVVDQAPRCAQARRRQPRRALEQCPARDRTGGDRRIAIAEQMLRHQARIGTPADHGDLIAVARSLDLGGVQYLLAHNGQPGTRVDAADRYPAPRWTPDRGWRIDPALASPCAAGKRFPPRRGQPGRPVGLMQVRPGTPEISRGRAAPPLGNLADPRVNLEYGQSYIELVRRNPITQGQLLKVMRHTTPGRCRCRAGTISTTRTISAVDRSLSYWETRYYVPTVLRNMWVYQGLAEPSIGAARARRASLPSSHLDDEIGSLIRQPWVA